MPRSLAQAQASRQNGARSRGPTTPEGKARAAQNARTVAMRSTDPCLADFEETDRFHELERSVYDRYRPLCPVEASLCARIAMALWRAERADQLEAEYWCLPVPVSRFSETLKLAAVLVHEEGHRPRSLATILRYQAEAMNAVTRALKALALLRAGTAEPRNEEDEPADAKEAGPAPANQNQPVPAAICTNEPEPEPAQPAPEPVEPAAAPARAAVPMLYTNEPGRAAASANSANEPGLSPPAPCSPPRAAPPR
ncbi:hypothetical protein [Geminicoccus roseus]|uniref:hypothetical protein n=1 Tax=Geminicoccus roseus TaxID=404900 RepID=UPI0004155D7D|nr:hypothetical protein [Geminicoccus roseus]